MKHVLRLDEPELRNIVGAFLRQKFPALPRPSKNSLFFYQYTNGDIYAEILLSEATADQLNLDSTSSSPETA